MRRSLSHVVKWAAAAAATASATSCVPFNGSVRYISKSTHPLHLLSLHNIKQSGGGGNHVSKGTAEAGAGNNSTQRQQQLTSHATGCPCCVQRRAYSSMHSSRDSGSGGESASAAASSPSSCGEVGGELDDAAALDFSLESANVLVEGMDAELATDVAKFVGGRLIQSLQREQPPRGSGIQPLLDYNKQWSGEIARLNPDYFYDLAKQQSPQYLWIGCSDSRVPANEIVGLYPGDVFVHRNIANIVCNSDLNALAVLQYSVDCLKVEHVIISGHYKCGGVTAALNEDRVGLADHWILHVGAVKKRHWKRMQDIPKCNHLDALCELNVIAQVENVVETHLIQRVWSRQNAEDVLARKENRPSKNGSENEVEIHGWVYGLEDGQIRPLLSLSRQSNIEKELACAIDAVFWRYGQI